MGVPRTTVKRTILLASIFALMVSAGALGQSPNQDSSTGELQKLQIGGPRTLQFALRLRY